MSKVIDAIYENGIFRPLGEINLRDRQRVKIEILHGGDGATVEDQKKVLLEFAGAGTSNFTDVARNHDRHLYRKE